MTSELTASLNRLANYGWKDSSSDTTLGKQDSTPSSSYAGSSPIGSLLADVGAGFKKSREEFFGGRHHFAIMSPLPSGDRGEEGDSSPVALAHDAENISLNAKSSPIPIVKQKPLGLVAEEMFARSAVPTPPPQEKKRVPLLRAQASPVVMHNEARFVPRSADDGFDLAGAVNAYHDQQTDLRKPVQAQTTQAGGDLGASSRYVPIPVRDKPAYEKEMGAAMRNTNDEDILWAKDFEIRSRQGAAFRAEMEESEMKLNGQGEVVSRRQRVADHLKQREAAEERRKDSAYIRAKILKNFRLTASDEQKK